MLDRLVFRPSWVIPRWIVVAYLIINWHVKNLADMVQNRPDTRFDDLVTKHVMAYANDGVMPPDDIAPAILNLADDYLAGKPMTLRAGDYIALQNHLRTNK